MFLKYIFHFSFTGVWLDSCAPEGEEYVFNCRPTHQVEISQERLNDWYEILFKEAEQRGMVYDVEYESTDKTQQVSFYHSVYFGISPYNYIGIYYIYYFMFQMAIQMKLRKTDELEKDPREDESPTCPIVECFNLREFFKTDDRQKYKCSTLSEAQYTTHALLCKMFQDLSTLDDID